VPPDLRRTVETRLGYADIGIDPIVIENILKYQLQGEQGVYNMPLYMEKTLTALVAWGINLNLKRIKCYCYKVDDLKIFINFLNKFIAIHSAYLGFNSNYMIKMSFG
tara:strand:+ start:151 stop:471 length:321 start_codon:yes stop_codon:yes gene_type:complete